jgi:hypothetical protein
MKSQEKKETKLTSDQVKQLKVQDEIKQQEAKQGKIIKK